MMVISRRFFMGKIVAIFVIIAVIGVGAFLMFSKPAEAPSTNQTSNTDTTKSDKTADEEGHMMNDGKMMEGDGAMDEETGMMEGAPGMMKEEVKITFDGNGFSPASVTIKVGTKVTWMNSSDKATWPASAMHPTHTVYPGSDIKKCGTAEATKIFDACHGLGKGESYSFMFGEKGSWNYHDHVNSGKFGKVIVE